MSGHEQPPDRVPTAESAERRGPKPIDARGPRFNQALVALLLLAGFVFEIREIIPAMGVVLLLSALGGARLGPFLRIYRDVVAPQLGPPTEIEDPRPPRFAATVGTVFCGVATLALVAGVPGLAWALALIVAALAALAAVTGLCVGCEAYVWFKKHSAGGWHDAAAGATGRAT